MYLLRMCYRLLFFFSYISLVAKYILCIQCQIPCWGCWKWLLNKHPRNTAKRIAFLANRVRAECKASLCQWTEHWRRRWSLTEFSCRRISVATSERRNDYLHAWDERCCCPRAAKRGLTTLLRDEKELSKIIFLKRCWWVLASTTTLDYLVLHLRERYSWRWKIRCSMNPNRPRGKQIHQFDPVDRRLVDGSERVFFLKIHEHQQLRIATLTEMNITDSVVLIVTLEAKDRC